MVVDVDAGMGTRICPRGAAYQMYGAIADGTVTPGSWEEDLYVDAYGGRFTVRLGRFRPVPRNLTARGVPLSVEPPAGTGWIVLPR